MGKPILCLSGGLDSVACLALEGASKCVFFDYGQAAAPKEYEAAQYYARLFKAPLQVIELPWLAGLSKESGLIEGRIPVFENSADLDDFRRTSASASAVWVPARNLVFLAVAAAVAESQGCDTVVLGLNREEGATFPDNSQAFVDSANQVLHFSTLKKVKVVAPVANLDKRQIVEVLKKRRVPLEALWSCYLGGAQPCGECESCARFNRAVGNTQ